MNQAISSTQTMSAKPDPSWMGVQPTALELYRLGLLRAASHHLPSIPPSNPWDCLAFRQISHRLIGWDRLYSERTGQEYIFQNYFDEALIGPEVLCDVSSVLRQFVSDTNFFSKSDQYHQDGKLDQAIDLQSNATLSSDDATESSIINSDDCPEGDGQDLSLGWKTSLAPPPPFLPPVVQTAPTAHLDFNSYNGHDCQPPPIAHDQPSSSSDPASSCNPRYRKAHLIDSFFDGMVDFKRRKILPA
ncbi:hypothetical protein PCANC_22738 [Puccinia coronata f. sp. avenae]|uniref:Uncharacterized protein n=1 Tax=Puccinia coronata f. sp. avenae TaxID=200324 RepID=A0A2N5U9R1_9BASI|nr:hypothetical protein PCANC_22738 [Puccinia coronata f. sp. avenae]